VIEPPSDEPRAHEDPAGAADDHGVEYFDGSEFAIRAGIEDDHYWHVHRRQIILRELEMFTKGSRTGLMELGCGIGTVATFLNAHGYEVDYADVFESALEIAAERARARLGDAAKARCFRRVDVTQSVPGGYRGLLLFDVIEHLPDDYRVMRIVRESLPARGNDAFVMITVPAFQRLWSPWDDVEKHKRRYTRAQVVRLLERTGFAVERITYFFAPLFFAASAVKVIRMVRDALAGPTTAASITELTEGQSWPLLNRVMLAALSVEKPLLSHGRLPLGTSILAIARAC
jgi:SAM-dependent methyltransferase